MSSTHRLKAVGKLICERLANIASVTYDPFYDKGRIVYDNTTQQLYFGSGQTTTFRTVYDIPLGTIVLFESNISMLGYSLLTNLNDYIVYGTRGSVAGGESGGSNKTGGTWTEPTHVHDMATHTHNLSHTHGNSSHTHSISGSHNHRWLDYVSTAASYSWTSNGVTQQAYVGNPNAGMGLVYFKSGTGHLDNVLGDFWTNYQTPTVSTVASGILAGGGTSTTPSTANSDPGSPANTWRPVGLNYTRQQRT